MKAKFFNLFLTFSVLAILAFSGFALTACNSSNKKTETIKIGYPGGAWPGGAFGVAITNGYLDEYLEPLGYKYSPVGFVGAAPVIHEALVAKELDYVVYAGMAADLSKSIGIDHTLISVTSWGAYWKLIVRNDAGINTLSDLRGKKIAYLRGASPHMYAIKALNEGGLTFNDIQPLHATSPDALAGLASGSIDAAVVGAGSERELVEDGTVKVIHVQFYADKNVYLEPSVFIARTEFHKKHPEIAVAIQKAFLKARDWIKEDPDRYFRLSAELSTNPLELVLETADYNIDGSIPLNLDDKYIDALRSILVFLRENELTKGDIDYASWLDRTVAVRALEEYNRGK